MVIDAGEPEVFERLRAQGIEQLLVRRSADRWRRRATSSSRALELLARSSGSAVSLTLSEPDSNINDCTA